MSDLTMTGSGHRNDASEVEKPTVTVRSVHESKVLHAFGDEQRVLLRGENTGGQLAMLLATTPPGSGPPPHYHENEDEWFYLLEGELEFFVDGVWREVKAGTAVFIPRNTIHTFKNTGDTPLKMLIQTTPAGFETFFKRCSEEFAKPGPPDMGRIIAISAEHGIHYVMD
ncbi:MAG: cupin domain-containing protein [Chloroflexota bacterium]